MTFSLRPATQQDLAFLLKLRIDSMESHLHTAGIYLTTAQHESRILHQFEHAYLVLLADSPIGLLKYESRQDCVHIMQFQLVPACQGKGYGRTILSQVIAAAGKKPVTLKVLKQNPAKRLYLSMGFEQVGEDADEYHLRYTPVKQ